MLHIAAVGDVLLARVPAERLAALQGNVAQQAEHGGLGHGGDVRRGLLSALDAVQEVLPVGAVLLVELGRFLGVGLFRVVLVAVAVHNKRAVVSDDLGAVLAAAVEAAQVVEAVFPLEHPLREVIHGLQGVGRVAVIVGGELPAGGGHG